MHGFRAPGASKRKPRPLATAGRLASGRDALGATGFGLERGCLDLRPPRLTQDLVALKSAGYEQDDWRKASPEDLLTGFGEGSQARTLLATALFAGTAQALFQGSYWAPAHAAEDNVEVDCKHLARPVSCLYLPTRMPTIAQLRPHGRAQPLVLGCKVDCSALDVCADLLATSVQDRHIALVRFTSTRDLRNESFRYSHCSEDQLFLRTSYYQAVERMDGDMCAPMGESLNEGGLIYTSGVGLLRGPLKEGCPWYREPAKIDVLWVSLPPHPQKGDWHSRLQDWYALDEESQAMANTLDLVFAWAAARGVDALIMPPPGCDSHGCAHPPLGVACVLREVAQRYEKFLPQVLVASDSPAHNAAWWESFSDVLQRGAEKPEPVKRVPPMQLPPHLRVKKEANQLLQKSRQVYQGRGGGNRSSRRPFLSNRPNP